MIVVNKILIEKNDNENIETANWTAKIFVDSMIVPLFQSIKGLFSINKHLFKHIPTETTLLAKIDATR